MGVLWASPFAAAQDAEHSHDVESERATNPTEAAPGHDAPRCDTCTALGAIPPTDGSGRPWWEWLRLKTGETIGGDFHGMRDGRLLFNSDEFGEVNLKWKSVREFYSSSPVTVVLMDYTTHVGPVRMDDNETVVVETAGGPVTVQKTNIMRINPSGLTELSNWYLNVSAGVNLANATVNQLAISGRTRIARDGEYTRLTLTHDFSFGRTQDEAGLTTDTSNHQWGLLKLDYFVSRLFYVTLASTHLGYDILQNIGVRVTPGAGVGFHILDGGPDFDLEFSGAYQYTSFHSVLAGDDDDSQGGGGGYRIYFDWDPIPRILGVTVEHRGFIIYSDDAGQNPLGQSTFRTSATIEFDIGFIFNLDLTLTHDRVVEPRQEADGTIPQADTWTMIVGLGLELGD